MSTILDTNPRKRIYQATYRVDQGGKWNTNIPEKKIDKIPQNIPQIPLNVPKDNRSFEYLVVLSFFGIPSNGLSLLSHDILSQEKATCHFKWKVGYLWIKNLNPHSP